jgi:manganese/zinc/iron transport system permease protein
MILAAQIEWPSWADVFRVMLLRDYNTRLVVVTTGLLGLACGLTGCYLLLRKRSLIGDAISHATLPGVGIAFLVMSAAGANGKWLPGLLAGAAVTGVTGCALVLMLRRLTRIKDDAAMGIVLSVFFGAGIVLLSMIQTMPEGNAAGLESFIYGKTASIIASDFQLLAGVALAVTVISCLLFKEFRMLCFDESYAKSQGWPILLLDTLLMGLVTAVTVAGLQAVGLILIIAFLITPAAAARFWTERTAPMLLLSGIIGAASGWLGASVSALLPRLPAGAIIVLVAATIFVVSLFLGTSRGVILNVTRRLSLHRRVRRQHLLRSAFEVMELKGAIEPGTTVPFNELLTERSWSPRELEGLVKHAWREDLVRDPNARPGVTLTTAGFEQAKQVTRNHRLWEMYLINYADIAPSHVDRDADAVEHVLGEEMVRELETAFAVEHGVPMITPMPMPDSPHPLGSQHPAGGEARP